MKIAYIILAYKSPEQLHRLISRLNNVETNFFVHIDKNTQDSVYFQMVKELKDNRNVIFIKRHKSPWGKWGGVLATLEGIDSIIESSVHFDYVINLSGQDYPIKSNFYINMLLKNSFPLSYINHTSVPIVSHPHLDNLINYWHINIGKIHLVFPRLNMFRNKFLNAIWNPIAERMSLRHKLPNGQKPFYGSAYWCLRFECIEYIHEFVHRNKSFVRFFNYVLFPDEFFFQTILLNSQFSSEMIDDSLRYIDFSNKQAHPKILSKHDFPKFMASNKLFARKFDSSLDPEVLDMIDEYLDASGKGSTFNE